MKSLTLAVVALALVVTEAQCGVVRSSGWSSEIAAVQTIALAPIDCSAVSLQCGPGDARMAQELGRVWPRDVVPFYKVRQAMFDLGVDRVTAETAPKIAEAVGADAVLAPSALAYDRESHGPGILATSQRGKASLVLFAKSGKKLVEGTEDYEGLYLDNAAQGILKPLLALIQQAFRFLPKGV